MQRIKALFDPQGLLNPGVILNPDPTVAPEEPEAAARRRRAGGQVHRVRLLRAEVPVARADAVATPAHRRLARDRPARRRRHRAAARGRIEDALRLPRHRDLRRLRPVRHRLPGGHRDRPADQGAARTPRRPGGEEGGRRRRPALRRADHRRAPRPGRRRPGARHRRHRRHEGHARRPAQGQRRALAEVVAGAGAAGALRAASRQPPQRAERVVYFPSCAARNMGAQRGHDGVEMLPTRGRAAVPARRLRRAVSARRWPASAAASPSRARG